MLYLNRKRNGKKLAALQKPYLNQRLCDQMLLAHNNGQIIIAIDPNAQDWRIESSLKAAVADWRGNAKPPVGEKDRTGQRLDVIAQFERGEVARKSSKECRNADLFTRYRRIIGSFSVHF